MIAAIYAPIDTGALLFNHHRYPRLSRVRVGAVGAFAARDLVG